MSGNWKLILGFLKSIIFGIVLSTVILGTIGFLASGLPGLANMATWGVILGIIGGVMSGMTTMMAKYSEEIGGNYSRWEEKEDGKKSNH